MVGGYEHSLDPRPLASNALGWEPITNKDVDRPLDTKEPHSAQAPGYQSGSQRLMGYKSSLLQIAYVVCMRVESRRECGFAVR
jgi:hypothetical protein